MWKTLPSAERISGGKMYSEVYNQSSKERKDAWETHKFDVHCEKDYSVPSRISLGEYVYCSVKG